MPSKKRFKKCLKEANKEIEVLYSVIQEGYSQIESENEELTNSLEDWKQIAKEQAHQTIEFMSDIEILKTQLEEAHTHTKELQEKLFEKQKQGIEVEQLQKQLEDEKEVWIRSRKIYKALQSNKEGPSLEEKAKNLYSYVRYKVRTEQVEDVDKKKVLSEFDREFDALPIEYKEGWIAQYLEISGAEFNS